MAEDKVFAKGLFLNKPNENAPDFIKLNIGIKVDDFKAFLDENKDDNGFVNIDMLQKKDKSGYYGQLNTFKSKKKEKVEEDVEDDPF